jgi:hypothetical protein
MPSGTSRATPRNHRPQRPSPCSGCATGRASVGHARCSFCDEEDEAMDDKKKKTQEVEHDEENEGEGS